ncbi:hypothetical protein RF11_15526 [Thelohanellus kitauei]|uniref:Uncharacterized protein n=1 Tax=Thelohanellus kitauei TaxID=669202 RepID=A0A0C2MZS4_THEKT|nr:hypothetical protein RF11_15526 [Thelohanellus kitauei]
MAFNYPKKAQIIARWRFCRRHSIPKKTNGYLQECCITNNSTPSDDTQNKNGVLPPVGVQPHASTVDLKPGFGKLDYKQTPVLYQNDPLALTAYVATQIGHWGPGRAASYPEVMHPSRATKRCTQASTQLTKSPLTPGVGNAAIQSLLTLIGDQPKRSVTTTRWLRGQLVKAAPACPPVLHGTQQRARDRILDRRVGNPADDLQLSYNQPSRTRWLSLIRGLAQPLVQYQKVDRKPNATLLVSPALSGYIRGRNDKFLSSSGNALFEDLISPGNGTAADIRLHESLAVVPIATDSLITSAPSHESPVAIKRPSGPFVAQNRQFLQNQPTIPYPALSEARETSQAG